MNVGFQNSARNGKRRLVTPHSILSALKHIGNTRVPCRGVVDKAVVHKRMTGKYMLDVFGGSGFVAKATSHLGLRGYVFDTKFGPKYDVTQHRTLTRIRQNVSARKCVAGMISLPRLHTSCSSTVISATASTASLLHRNRTPWILENSRASWLWEVPKIQTLVSGWECGQQGCATCCTKVCLDWWPLQCDWTKTRSSQGVRVALKVSIFP